MATLKDSDKRMLLALKPDDITKSFIEANFVHRLIGGKEVPPKISFQDEFSLKKGEYFNTENIPKTNVGLFIYNKYIVEPMFIKTIGYQNIPINSKELNNIGNKVSKAALNDEITPIDYGIYFDKIQFLLSIHTMVAGSFTSKTLKPLPSVMKRKKELLKENREAIDRGDPITAVRIENELIDIARKELKGDPGMDLYNSGSRGSFGNNYKNMVIMRGAAYNPLENRFKIMETSFVEGIEKKDIPDYGTMVVSGSYPKAVGTQIGE